MGWKFLLPISDAGRTHFGCVSRITATLTGQTRRGNHDRRTEHERRGWSG